ncbi:MAG: hypothetical protein ACOCR1_02655 [Planctomycetota bacterium]
MFDNIYVKAFLVGACAMLCVGIGLTGWELYQYSVPAEDAPEAREEESAGSPADEDEENDSESAEDDSSE